jgi:bacillithiol system protein YtxJ
VSDSSLIEIEDLDELNSALEQSASTPVLLFKHSVTCGISARADRQMNKLLSSNPPENALYRLIIVQHARTVSNTIASQLGVPHESPQVIIVRNGKTVWTASHDDITADNVRRALTSAA